MTRGANEVEAGAEVTDRVRAEGAGDKPAVEKQPGLWDAIDNLVSPTTRGHPMSTLRWTLKSTYELSRQVTDQGFEASAELVRRLLAQNGYSLQAPAKEVEGKTHPDRDGQFRYVAELSEAFITAGDPHNVVGISLPLLRMMLADLGIAWHTLWAPGTVRDAPQP